MNFNFKEFHHEEAKAGSWAAGFWYDVPGKLALPKAICEAERPDGCEVGWRSRGSSCYRMLAWHWDFESARLQCEELQSHLVTIADEGEQLFVQGLCGAQMCWLGLLEHQQTESWFWLDGTSLDFQNWQDEEPNNVGGDENRGVMNMNLLFEEKAVQVQGRELQLAVALACVFGLILVIACGSQLLRGPPKADELLPLDERELREARSPPLRMPVAAE
ncbi:unnamed protein product [Effrenium voratum]|uniref:C-type lectin domain-containing protein n=1 Tax=Effrenium voratum TaxID=2562239 RepID=A0AA36IDU4_9DINO|nr:unnamed protein product [Effrenium voratum]